MKEPFADPPDEGQDSLVIDAMPTKELFIEMLTRDIALIPAIIDLVDNSADGAKRVKGEGSLKGFLVRLTITSDQFKITDNCGGITVETARKYAFRFGRASGAPSVKHSVGQFGVGMKRAIFKIGRQFRVESTTDTSRFVVDVDVNAWAEQPKKWTFEFAERDEDTTHSKDSVGTEILITALHPDVADVFGLESFEGELRNDMRTRLQDPISRGLVVTVNGVPVDAEPMTMLSDPRLAPAYRKLTYNGTGAKTVTAKLYCGLGRSESRSEERAEAGWNVFCNGRLILEADKSPVTGWKEEVDSVSIPGFHGQYNYLRGIAYFDSDDPARLPWNTTKTGLNTDSPIYRAVKLEMMRLMRPVVDFLNRLKEERQAKDDPGEKGPLEELVESAKPEPVMSIDTRPVFEPPVPKPKSQNKEPKMQPIHYEAPADQVYAVKKVLKVNSFRDVGLKTFKYFYDAEVNE